jgi:hypothetical protein
MARRPIQLVLVVREERQVERRVDLADVVLGDDRREAARHLGDAAVDEAVVLALELTPGARQVRDHAGDQGRFVFVVEGRGVELRENAALKTDMFRRLRLLDCFRHDGDRL